MSLPYYKKYPRDFFEGTAHMRMELKGCYDLVIDLIYMHQPRGLPDNSQYISGHLGCSVRKWNSLRKELLTLGKINTDLDIISTLRSDKEQLITSKYRNNQAKKGRESNKNKDLAKTTVKPAREQPKPESESYRKEKEEEKEMNPVIDPRDPIANQKVSYIFQEKQWFTDSEIKFMEDNYPDIDIHKKIESESFREWCFLANPQVPLKPARAWFKKQKRVAAADDSLMQKYDERKKMVFGDTDHLIDALLNRK
jgi:uncharacterized protein YdaU (DUF1376 family)